MLCFLTIYFNLGILYGESPSFVRQEIDDSIDDIDKCNIPNPPSVDIKGISYISDNKVLNATVWLNSPFKSFIKSDSISSDLSSSNARSNVIYDIVIIDSSLPISSFIKTLIDHLTSIPHIDSIELIPMKTEDGENFKIIFNNKFMNSKYIWLLTIQNNIKYLHSFEIYDYNNVNRKYLSIVNNIINSTKFIENNNSTYADYENPYFGIKLQYPIKLVQHFDILTFFPREFINDDYYKKWEPIFGIRDQHSTIEFNILTKNKTENFTLEDYKREMIELYRGSYTDNIVNYTNDFELEKLLNVKKNYIYFKIEGVGYSSISNYILTFITKGDKMYSFVYGSNNDKSFLQNLALYNNIINSTKFIENSNSTYADYENPYFGIKLQYPINWKIDKSTYIPNKKSTLNRLIGYEDTISENYFSSYRLATFKSDNQSRITNNADNFDGTAYYYMLIDVSSVYDKGTDYAIQIQWNKTSSTWDRMFIEVSAAGGRLLDIEHNISDFYDNSQSSKTIGGEYLITFSLNLDKINNPDKYKIMIGTSAVISSCVMDDVSQLLSIPPPNYSINPIRNHQLTLYPTDERNLDIQINSDSSTSSTIFLDSKSKEDNGINVNFTPSVIYLNPNENGFSKVKVSTKDTLLGTHNIPISANITFPPKMQFSVGGETRNYFNPVMTSVPLKANLTVTVEPVPPFYQPAIDFTKNVIEPSAGFITATIIPIATALFGLRIYFKKKHSLSRNKPKRNNMKKQSAEES